METIESLVSRLTEYRNAYYNGTPLVSDFDFDEAESILRERDPNNTFFSKVGAPVASNKKRKHKIPMFSLDKIKLEDDGVNTLIKNYLSKGDMICSYKMDGISFSVDYKDGVFVSATTRGDGIEGEIIEDATTIGNVRNVVSYTNNYMFNGTLRGELVMNWEDFEFINSHLPEDEKFSNPRNATAGIVRKENSPYKKYIKAYYYNMIEDNITDESKFHMFEYLEAIVGESAVVPFESFTWDCFPAVLSLYVNRMDKNRKFLPYMIDGLVFEYDDLEYYNSLGVSSDGNPKGAVALKLTAVAETTQVVDVVWQNGSTGAITPVICVAPTLIDGSLVSRASLHNYDIFKSWNLGIGDVVSMQKNNDIIPQLKEVIFRSENTRLEAPTHCSLCGTELVFETIKTTNLKCPNINCSCRKIGDVSKLVDSLKLNEKGVGIEFIKSYCEKYDNVWSLFTLSVDDIKSISERYQDKSATNIYNAIQSVTGSHIKPETFFRCLNIDGCGGRTFKRLIDKCGDKSVDSVVTFINEYDLTGIDGIGEITANAIIDGIKAKAETIEQLKKYLNIATPVFAEKDKGSILFTGSFSIKRKELEDMAINAGFVIGSSVNSSLTYLAQADVNSTSSKSVKAKKLGVKIIDEDEFMEMVKQ